MALRSWVGSNIGRNSAKGDRVIPATPAGDLLIHCYSAAIAAVQPARALHAPLRASPPSQAPTWIISAGKAAPGMATAIVEWLAESGRAPIGGVIVAAEPATPPHETLQ